MPIPGGSIGRNPDGRGGLSPEFEILKGRPTKTGKATGLVTGYGRFGGGDGRFCVGEGNFGGGDGSCFPDRPRRYNPAPAMIRNPSRAKRGFGAF
jgi:hypothetical protein